MIVILAVRPDALQASLVLGCQLDFIGNKIQWPYAHLYNAPE
jgi:hypothetical protein